MSDQEYYQHYLDTHPAALRNALYPCRLLGDLYWLAGRARRYEVALREHTWHQLPTGASAIAVQDRGRVAVLVVQARQVTAVVPPVRVLGQPHIPQLETSSA